MRFTNGVNQSLAVQPSSSINNPDTPTVIMWASLTTVSPAAQRNFFGKSTGNNNWVGFINSTGITAQYGRQSGTSASAGATFANLPALAANVPMFFVFQNDISVTANNRVFVGHAGLAAKEATTYAVQRTGSLAHDDSASVFSVANGSGGGTTNTLPGNVHSIQGFRRILTLDELVELQFSWQPKFEGCVLALRPGLNGLLVALDESGYGNHATSSGSPESASALLPWNAPRRSTVAILKPALFQGGTVYTSSLAGSLTPAGAVGRATSKPLAGSSTPAGTFTGVRAYLRSMAGTVTVAGTVVRQDQKTLTGSTTPGGSVSKATSKPLAGSSTPAGSMTAIRAYLRTFTGSLTPSGTLVRAIAKGLAGTVTATGAAARQAQARLAGTTSAAGALSRRPAKVLAGATTPSGALAIVRAYLRTFVGNLTPSGLLTRQGRKSHVASVTPTGALSTSGGVVNALPENIIVASLVSSQQPRSLDVTIDHQLTASAATRRLTFEG